MEDSVSAMVEHQNQRKRSSSDNNAFAKFVPLASPLGDVGDGVFQEPNPQGHDHNGHKRHKRNSDALLLSESAYVSSFSSSSSLPTQSLASDNNLQFPSPSNSTKHSTDTRTSPSSIASKFNMQYQELDAKCTQSLSPVSYNWKEDQIDVGSVGSMAAEQLSKRPKVGEIYKTIEVHRESTLKRLKDLCNKEPTIDVGVEMADAASLLKLMNFSTNEIESAGQKAQRGAMMLLQAEILRKNGIKLLCECQELLRDTL